ncbi:hypothetical protein HK101_009631 [Irineochytrium annulatum]|nr:hypothetical protein HK101_009631 [Irineochytrium annulatum]
MNIFASGVRATMPNATQPVAVDDVFEDDVRPFLSATTATFPTIAEDVPYPNSNSSTLVRNVTGQTVAYSNSQASTLVRRLTPQSTVVGTGLAASETRAPIAVVTSAASPLPPSTVQRLTRTASEDDDVEGEGDDQGRRNVSDADEHEGLDDMQLQALREIAQSATADGNVISGMDSSSSSRASLAEQQSGDIEAGGMRQRRSVSLMRDDGTVEMIEVVVRNSMGSREMKPAPLPVKRPSIDMADSQPTRNQTQPLPVLDRCCLCNRPFTLQDRDQRSLPVRSIKPRFLRELRRACPPADVKLLALAHPDTRVCLAEIHAVMQRRVERLLEEDQDELSRLQDSAMKNLASYEQNESSWQKQFESGWSMSEKAADLVARFGGSWRFIGCLLLFLASWAAANLLLSKFATNPDAAWDPYPFILLNLMLSCVAALQAPIIMMSQNRQAQIDRTQNDYVSKIILRAEHQVRHVNAKLDHLLNHQWKRLLECQEIQADLLHGLQTENRHFHHTHMTVGDRTPFMTPFHHPVSPHVPVTPLTLPMSSRDVAAAVHAADIVESEASTVIPSTVMPSTVTVMPSTVMTSTIMASSELPARANVSAAEAVESAGKQFVGNGRAGRQSVGKESVGRVLGGNESSGKERAGESGRKRTARKDCSGEPVGKKAAGTESPAQLATSISSDDVVSMGSSSKPSVKIDPRSAVRGAKENLESPFVETNPLIPVNDHYARHYTPPPLSLPLSYREVVKSTTPWSAHLSPDVHASVLLSHYLGNADGDDLMIFAHWHSDGDNFTARVNRVALDVRRPPAPGAIRRIQYELEFNDPTASLDDVLAGEGSVTLRNDLDLDHMRLAGKVVKVDVAFRDRPSGSFLNGELPTRYKPSFHLKRSDKITEFWRAPLARLAITYQPPPLAVVLELAKGQRIVRLHVDFTPIFGGWTKVASASWELQRASALPGGLISPTTPSIPTLMAAPSAADVSGDLGDEARAVTVVMEEVLEGPAAFVFVCDEVVVAMRGFVEELAV